MMNLSKYQPKLQRNEAHAGIELSFAVRPPQEAVTLLTEQGFRWHAHDQLWFAKYTPERYDFARSLIGKAVFEAQSKMPLHVPDNNAIPTSEQSRHSKNTFAASYDCIGNAKILQALEGSLHSHTEAYFEKENLYFRRTFGADHITFLELQNAQKAGTVCTEWHIYPDYGSKTTLHAILRKVGADDLQTLWTLCRSGELIAGVTVSKQEHKGVDIFSPFTEVKPLKKLPDKWTKRNFTQALMSGQVYCGDIAYRYTDDYAYDAAVGFRTGERLNMPAFAKNAVGDWGVCTSCSSHAEITDEYGGCALTYSEHINSSKTLWFDVHCSIAEGKHRADTRSQRIEEQNHKLEMSCIHVRPSSIDPVKCYSITTLDKYTNSGAYGAKSMLVQGHVLQERLAPDHVPPDLLSLEELEIEQARFYTIADFFHRRDHETDDKRIIGCGNFKQIVTGKALLELTREGISFPVLLDNDPEYSSYASAYQHLLSQACRTSRFQFSHKQDFAESLDRLTKEYHRTGPHALEMLIQDAGRRQTVQEIPNPAPAHQR